MPNPNFTNRNKFKILVSFPGMKNFEFFAKGLTFGGMNIGTYTQSTPIYMRQLPGDSFQADTAVIDFYIDENWEAFKEIFRWMKKLKDTRKTGHIKPDYLAEITVTMLDSKYYEMFNYIMIDAWPNSITSMNLDTDDDISTLLGQAIFVVNDYDILDKN